MNQSLSQTFRESFNTGYPIAHSS